ncbi:hypothetical protein JTE90_018206 [Oedothorax gibbosus]|uniref:Uncharacterized protein n=1 Tax=Oedothorax gibbosus TaxID=931172 RepID=A0AAV6U9S4_9ARAC|nr:hypothetical protein JTE90_018206 [Oedothorax gibbosus]
MKMSLITDQKQSVRRTLDRDFDVCVGVTIDQDDVANNESGALEATMDQDNGTSIDMTLDLVDDGSVHEAEKRLVDDSENGSMDQDNDGSAEEPLDRVDVGSVKRTVDRDDDGSSVEVSMAEGSNATHKINSTDEEETSWIHFAGSFIHVTNILEESKKLLNELKGHSIINEKFYTVQALSCLKSLKEDCDKSIKLGENILKRFENEEKLVHDECFVENSLVNHDPGLREPIESNNQETLFDNSWPSSAKIGNFSE